MASGPHWNKNRGTWSVQYWDGRWRRVVVVERQGPLKKNAPKPKAPAKAYEELARLIEVEKAAKSRKKKNLPASLDTFLDAHIQTYANPLSKKSVKTTSDQFLAWCKDHKITQFEQVTSERCGDWVDEQAKSLAYTTVFRKMAQLSAAWSRVAKRKKIDNPWDSVDLAGKPKIKRRGSWTKEEFAALLAVCRPWLQNVLIVGVHTGLRINALLNLRWEHIEHAERDADGFGNIRIPPELDKTGKGYVIPIFEDLDALLTKLRIVSDSEFIVTGQNEKPISSRTITGTAIYRACARAKLRKPDSPNHHLRRTFGRWAHFGYLTGESVPLYIVAQWLGHSNTNTTLKYLDIKEEDSTRFMLKKKTVDQLGQDPVST